MEEQFLPSGPKGKILVAALDLIVEAWPTRLSLAEVARSAKTSKPRISYHYKSIDEIIHELTISWAKSGQFFTVKGIEKNIGAPPKELIIEILDATFEWKKKCPKLAALTPMIIHFSLTSSPITTLIDKAMEVGLKRISDLLSRLDSPTQKSKGELVDSARAIHLMIVGCLIYSISVKASAKIEKKLLAQVKRNIDLLLVSYR